MSANEKQKNCHVCKSLPVYGCIMLQLLPFSCKCLQHHQKQNQKTKKNQLIKLGITYFQEHNKSSNYESGKSTFILSAIISREVFHSLAVEFVHLPEAQVQQDRLCALLSWLSLKVIPPSHQDRQAPALAQWLHLHQLPPVVKHFNGFNDLYQ